MISLQLFCQQYQTDVDETLQTIPQKMRCRILLICQSQCASLQISFCEQADHTSPVSKQYYTCVVNGSKKWLSIKKGFGLCLHTCTFSALHSLACTKQASLYADVDKVIMNFSFISSWTAESVQSPVK